MRFPRFPRRHGLFASFAAAAAAIAALVASTAVAGPAVDDETVALNFEPWSNRLLSSEGARIAHLADQLNAHPDERLLLEIPQPVDRGARQFVAARVAAVDAELGKRGLVADKRPVPAANADGVLVLRLVNLRPERTPVEIVPAVAAEETKPAPAAAPVADRATASDNRPVPLLPDGGRPAAPAAEAPSTGPDTANVPPAPPAVEELWIAASGQMLRDVLKEWGDRAGWTVVWQSDHEYPIDASATFSGDFTAAASQLVEGFAGAAPAPMAHLYKGNRVLLVQSGEGR